ncbi:MAG: hypothetical protein ALAOOOJD_03775 [bacterium]|nr:hypothetical protein [bacterium]
MNGNAIVRAPFVEKIRRREPRKIMHILRVKRNVPAWLRFHFFCNAEFHLGILFCPVGGGERGVDLYQRPAGIAFGHHAGGADDIIEGHVNGHVEGAKFTVKFALRVKRIRMPAGLVIDAYFRVPLRKVKLIAAITGTILEFFDFLFEGQLNANFLAGF